MRVVAMITALVVCGLTQAAEEKIRGVIEKTAKTGASAQITDALNETYYIVKSDDTEKMIANYVGKNIKVIVTGTVESKDGDPAYFFNLKSVEKYEPKMPPAPPSAPTAPAEKKEEPKTGEKPAEQMPAETRVEEKK